MAVYKVINLDSPIESDYWVDIPVRDPATNKDAVDEEGRILVERHVTRSVKNEELSNINTAVETVNTLKALILSAQNVNAIIRVLKILVRNGCG